jgi:predicted acylesterase/phospholipase RssA
MSEKNIKNKLVISGGGVKGLTILGYLHKLYENNLLDNINKYCGTSVGSIICFLLLIGYKPNEIFYILMEIDFESLLLYSFDDILDNPHIGLYSTKPILFTIKKMTKNKKISLKINFKELFEKFNKSIAITGVCLNDNSLHFFDKENNPNMEVIKAIEISISIPLVFKPVNYNNKIWVDGGTLNNYPINYFDNDLDNLIGIKLKSEDIIIEQFNSHQDYLYQLMKCLLKSINNNKKKYKKITIELLVDNINDININNEKKLELYNQGYNHSIKNFL